MSKTNQKSEKEMTRESAEEALKQMTEELERLSANELPSNPSMRSTRRQWSGENWEEEMERHPFFSKGVDTGYQSSPLVDALRQLKYDEEFNSPEELVNNYREDGNENFRRKKYLWAIDSYSESIRINCDDNHLMSIVYNNRASAHFHLKNYRSSLKDALKAYELDSDNIKAVNRIVFCYFQLKEYQNCCDFCQNNCHKNSEILSEYMKKAINELKITERNERKFKIEEQKRKLFEDKILSEVKKRGIKVNNNCNLFESIHPATDGKHVTINENGLLVWPVIFIYPEYGESDFIECFHENHTFLDHLNIMFEEFPEWDIKHKYKSNNIIVGYKDSKCDKIITFDTKCTLSEILKDGDYVLESAIPTFIITCGVHQTN
ncbi:tetratricopeptide repeat protein 4-like isoform X2 [Oppia nitens]|uniref:tetratricopeptide repeat protein 4-like isoform X2 n=1 Tax=Oppia nitens TaxID=1686743 RepID=UPI0023DB3D6E|nr:tetratricopeptide repeat protein 4-like isoform X2 [Oppia nitens]